MKKVLFVICLAGTLMTALALGAHASEIATEESWKVYLVAASGGDAVTPNDNAAPAFAQSHTSSTIIDDPSTRDWTEGTPPPPTDAGQAVGGWYRPWGADGAYGLFLTDNRRPLEAPYHKEWKDFVVHVKYSAMKPYPSTSLVLLVGGSGVPNTIDGFPVQYKLVMTFHPASYEGPTEWTLPPYPVPETSTKTHWTQIALPLEGTISNSPISGTGPLGDGAEQVYGYRFDFIVTPEPGSLLALGTGLAGFLGVVRRRKS